MRLEKVKTQKERKSSEVQDLGHAATGRYVKHSLGVHQRQLEAFIVGHGIESRAVSGRR